MWEEDVLVNAHPLRSVHQYKPTYILPYLVMRLVKNRFIVGNIVVLENGLSFWARWVHMLQVLKAERVKKKGKGNENGEGGTTGDI